jgi:hypothetical protein
MRTPSQTLSLTVRRSSFLFPPIHAILMIDLSPFLSLLLFSVPMSHVSLCLSQPQCLPSRQCRHPSCPLVPLIADSGCTSILIQIANFPSLSPFFVAKPLPQVPFTLPDGSCLEVGCPEHITGELTFPHTHKLLPVSVYFLPPSSLSHSLFGVSPLIRPHGHAVFDNHSCSFFDSPQALLPFLTGTKAERDDLWFLQVPSLPEPQHSPSILFSLQELPHAKFVPTGTGLSVPPPSPPSSMHCPPTSYATSHVLHQP